MQQICSKVSGRSDRLAPMALRAHTEDDIPDSFLIESTESSTPQQSQRKAYKSLLLRHIKQAAVPASEQSRNRISSYSGRRFSSPETRVRLLTALSMRSMFSFPIKQSPQLISALANGCLSYLYSSGCHILEISCVNGRIHQIADATPNYLRSANTPNEGRD